MAQVDAAERAGALERWLQEDAPTSVMAPAQEPAPGTIEGRRHWPELDVTMLELGNGMKVGPEALCTPSGFPRRSRQAQQPFNSIGCMHLLAPCWIGSPCMLQPRQLCSWQLPGVKVNVKVGRKKRGGCRYSTRRPSCWMTRS